MKPLLLHLVIRELAHHKLTDGQSLIRVAFLNEQRLNHRVQLYVLPAEADGMALGQRVTLTLQPTPEGEV